MCKGLEREIDADFTVGNVILCTELSPGAGKIREGEGKSRRSQDD